MADSSNVDPSMNPTSEDDDALYIRTLEQLQLQLSAIQRARAFCVERFNRLRSPQSEGDMLDADRLAEIEDLRQRLQNLAAAEADCTGRITEAEDLEHRYQAMREFEKAALERRATIKNEREKQAVDALLKRAFSDACGWDRKHKSQLFTLALKPKESSWIFRLQNWLHLRVHRH